MPKIWESSVVIALRDSQWERAIEASKEVGKFVSLSGNFEPGSADAIEEMGGRFLLLEVKGQEGDIRNEWARNVKDEDGSSSNSPKPVLSRVMNLAIGFAAASTKQQNLDFVRYSMQCHHFAFWKGSAEHGPNPSGEIMIGPYMALALQRLRNARFEMQKSAGFKGTATPGGCLQALGDCFNLLVRQDMKSPWRNVDYFGVNALGKELADLQEIRSLDQPLSMPFGLEGPAFKEYLDFLRGGLSGEEIHSVIYSPDTGYFRYIRNFDCLHLLCDPNAQSSLQQPATSDSNKPN